MSNWKNGVNGYPKWQIRKFECVILQTIDFGLGVILHRPKKNRGGWTRSGPEPKTHNEICSSIITHYSNWSVRSLKERFSFKIWLKQKTILTLFYKYFFLFHSRCKIPCRVIWQLELQLVQNIDTSFLNNYHIFEREGICWRCLLSWLNYRAENKSPFNKKFDPQQLAKMNI